MKHHCHCGLGEKVHQLKAGKLGLLGGALLVLHLLVHVAECLIVPALIVAFRGETVATSELDETEIEELASQTRRVMPGLKMDFWQSLEDYSPIRLVQDD